MYVQRISEKRLLEQVLDWVPPGKRRRGRPIKGSRQGVDEEMLRYQLPYNLWKDRHVWRLGVTERQSTLLERFLCACTENGLSWDNVSSEPHIQARMSTDSIVNRAHGCSS